MESKFKKGDVVYYAGRACKIRNVYPDSELKYTAETGYRDEEGKVRYIQMAINKSQEKSMYLINREE